MDPGLFPFSFFKQIYILFPYTPLLHSPLISLNFM
jgi:hypothetical protein